MTKLIGSASLTADKGTDLSTKGDLHGYSTSNTRIPVGSNDQVLTADSGEALGVKWATASGGATLTRTVVATTTTQSVSSTSMVDLTSITATLQAGTGMCICNYCCSKIDGAQNGSMRWTFSTDGDQDQIFCNDNGTAQSCYAVTETLSGQTAKMQGKVNGAGSIDFQESSKEGLAYWLEIS